MGDGTARLSERAPGGTDPRAVGFDAAVVDALAPGDPSALVGLDPRDGADLVVGGRAGVACGRGQRCSSPDPDRRWAAMVTSHAVPYGVVVRRRRPGTDRR